VLIGVLVACALVVLYLIVRAIVPRWWAQRVGKVVDGSLTTGALYGLFIGFVFTLVPVVALIAVIRFRRPERSWKGWLAWLAVVGLLAAPNLMTLNIVLNNTRAGGHAGDRTLDTLAPGFRVWSVVGAVLAVVAVIAVWYLARSRRTSRRRASEYRDELRSRDDQT
jgi:TRAP-type uncharacterized transport system fused permease subunit